MEIKLRSTPIHSDTHGLRWIRVHPNKTLAYANLTLASAVSCTNRPTGHVHPTTFNDHSTPNLAATVPSPQHMIQSLNPREKFQTRRISSASPRSPKAHNPARDSAPQPRTNPHPAGAVPFPRCPLPVSPNRATHLSNPAPIVSKPRQFPRDAALRRSSNFRASARRNGSRRRELGLGSPGRA